MEAYKQLADWELVKQFKEGKVEAMEVLINRYKDKLFTSILIIVKDKHLAEDLFQDAFIKIIDTIKKGGYNEEGKFLPWASTIARHLCVDYFRKEKRKPSVSTYEYAENLDYTNSAEESYEDKLIKGQTHDRLRKLIEELPEDQKTVITLRHFADMSFKEIAELTNCSINTALGRMRYGLINLRKMMAQKQISL